MLTAQFLLGIKLELCYSVVIQLPDSIARSTTLAAIQEKLLDNSQKKPRKSANPKLLALGAKQDSKPNVSLNDMWKARQLHEHRLANSLCFKYGEKYAPGHKCADPSTEASLHQLSAALSQSDDGGGMICDELLQALEWHPNSVEKDYFLSIHAISSTPSSKVIHLRALVQNQVLSILVDSENSHSFLNSAMLSRLNCKVPAAKNMTARVANGQKIFSNQMVQDFQWWIQGNTFSMDVRVLDLAAYDLILGMDWLE
jgi:hypothetical protein